MMKSIEKLLSIYIDELNSDKKPDIDSYLKQCPIDQLTEFQELIASVGVYKACIDSIYVNTTKADSLFSKLENMLVEMQKSEIPERYAANFRKKSLSQEDQKKLSDKFDKIWDEEFGDDV